MRTRYACIAILFVANLTARAETFSLSALLQQQASLSGTITIDTQAGTVTDSNLLFVLGNYSTTVTGDASVRRVTSTVTPITSILDQNVASELLTLDLPVANLIGYGGGNVCSFAGPYCFNTSSSIVISTFRANLSSGPTSLNFQSGSLTRVATSATPEPSGLSLLGTGVLGLASMLRKRFV